MEADGPPDIHPSAVIDRAAAIAPGARVGPGAVISPAARIAAGAIVGPTAVILQGARIAEAAEIGAAAVIGEGVSVGARARIRPGSIVVRNVPPGAIVEGHPALITGYIDATKTTPLRRGGPPEEAVEALSVDGVTVHRLQVVRDLRGGMTVGEFERSVPFAVRRYYVIYDVPTSEVRGEHAHRECHGFLVCLHGTCSVVVDDGARREEVLLDSPEIGLYRPPMIWSTQYKYTRDAVLLIFASHYYDAGDYIRSYDEFLAERRKASRPAAG